MHATLIFPGITSCGWNCFGKVDNSEAHFIPHGLAYIAAYARLEGHAIDILDLRRLSGWRDFEGEIKKRSPGVFGLSSMSVDFGVTLETIQRIKKIDKKSVLILGGVHATVAFEDIKGLKEIDYIVRGEGEIVFSELLKKLENDEKTDRCIYGVTPDVDALPYPDRELFGFSEGEMRSPWLPHMPAPFVSIIASRGCPYKCTFCQPAERAVFGGKARIRKVEGVIEELKYLRERYHFRSVLIHDDLFAFNPRWIERFCKEYEKNGFDQVFTCQVRSDFIVNNKALIGRMAESGLSCFMIGLESGCQRVLDFLAKGTTVEMNGEAVEICRAYGIKIFANYMLGIPTETPEEVFQTIDFIRWAKPDYPSPAFFTPHPGSDLYDYCMKNDLSLIKSYKSYARNPTEPKIKGVDYNFLNFAIHRSTEYKIDERLGALMSLPQKSIEINRAILELNGTKKELKRLDHHYKETYMNRANIEMNSSQKGEKGKQKILVTGGTGFIGSVLVKRLLEEGYDVTILTRNRDHPNAIHFESNGARIVEGFVENKETIEKLDGFNLIFHLAIFQGTEGPEMIPVNVGGTENMLEVALKNGTEKFIYASSIEAQGTSDNHHIPLNEEMECHPVSEYGLSKLEGEKIVLKRIKEDGLKGIIARIGNVYGAGGLSFIHPMSAAIIERNALLASLPLIADRLVQPIYIDDLVDGFISAIENGNGMSGIYNFTGHQPVTIETWFKDLAVLLGLEENVSEALKNMIDDSRISELKKAHPHVNYFLSGDAPNIHRAYSDEKLVNAIGDYQSCRLSKGLAYTLNWYYRLGLFNSYF